MYLYLFISYCWANLTFIHIWCIIVNLEWRMNLCWIAKCQYFYYLHGMHYTTHAGKSSAIIWKCSMRKKFGQQYTSIKVIAANFQNLARIRKAISVETTYLHAYMFYDYQCGTYIFIYNISRNICKHLFDRM